MVEVDQRNEWRQFSESPWISVEVALPHEMAEAEVLLQQRTGPSATVTSARNLWWTSDVCEAT